MNPGWQGKETMNKSLDIIAAIPIFNGLPEDQMAAIKQIAITKRFNKGEVIFSEGDAGNGFFVIARGRVKIFKVSAEGKEHILHIYGSGQPFGEVPVFAGQKFPANAQALEKTVAIFLPRSDIVDLVAANPSLAMNMLAVMSQKLRQFSIQIENLSLKEIPARLASYLIFLAEEQAADDVVKLNISKGQLASILGTIPETLSRMFAKLTAQNLIRVEGKKITLLDREGLEDMAEYGKEIE
jgi:CRP/FNR family transcriptional regulator